MIDTTYNIRVSQELNTCSAPEWISSGTIFSFRKAQRAESGDDIVVNRDGSSILSRSYTPGMFVKFFYSSWERHCHSAVIIQEFRKCSTTLAIEVSGKGKRLVKIKK